MLFDRAQVATWAATRGFTAEVGFLSPDAPDLAAHWRLEALLRQGGIWRDTPSAELAGTLGRLVQQLPATTPAVRNLVAQRLQASGGLTLAPVGGGYALPHPSARIALGRNSGTLALILLRDPLTGPEPAPDGVPITRLFFFIAPTPRAHLDLLGQLSRMLARRDVRDVIANGGSDAEILTAVAASDDAAAQRTSSRP